MAQMQYSTLLAAVQAVPDPRKARGKRYAWAVLLTIIVAGLASNYQTARAIAQWVRLHFAAWQAAIPELHRAPSESTLLRTLRLLDVAVLEHYIAAFVADLPEPNGYPGCIITPQGEIIQGQALDGKTVRTTSVHGNRTHLVSQVTHGSGRTLAQIAVAAKSVETSACHTLLRGQDLSGIVLTMDAGLTQRSLAQQIRQQHGHYLMIVKANHPQMYAELATFFTLPGILADDERYDRYRSVTKAHGRLETRTLVCLRGNCADWRWPDVGQVIQRTCERQVRRKGKLKRSYEVSYGLTSVPPEDAGAEALETLWRGHWTIENRKHYVRDVTLGEDRHPMYRGTAPQALAAIRNGLIDLWRAHGWRYIADAVRACAASLPDTLTLIGALPKLTLT